jgi:hypothetical protein
VHAFSGGTNGYNPFAGLLPVDAMLYGTTASGGAPCEFGGCGTVFSLRP